MAYKQAIDQQRVTALDELAAQAQELGMGYCGESRRLSWSTPQSSELLGIFKPVECPGQQRPKAVWVASVIGSTGVLTWKMMIELPVRSATANPA
jgi:hypothetical protein